jgi:hypothetical protein
MPSISPAPSDEQHASLPRASDIYQLFGHLADVLRDPFVITLCQDQAAAIVDRSSHEHERLAQAVILLGVTSLR